MMYARVGRVISQEIKINRDRKTKSRMLRVAITSDKDVQTVEYFSGYGDNSVPPVGADVVVLAIGEAWKIAIASRCGIEPTGNEPGTHEIRSTDAIGTTVKARIILHADGNIEVIPAAGGKITLASDVDILGSIDMTGTIGGTTVFNGAASNTHKHDAGDLLDSGGNPCSGTTDVAG